MLQIVVYLSDCQRCWTWRHDGLGQPGSCGRSDRVAVDVVLLSFDGQRVGQPQQTQLGRAVVGLAEVPVDPCCGRRHDDPEDRVESREHRLERETQTAFTDLHTPPELLVLHVVPGGPCDEEGPPQVHSLNQVWDTTEGESLNIFRIKVLGDLGENLRCVSNLGLLHYCSKSISQCFNTKTSF